ncbi:unnamed protein product [Fraxinus pennsylvanica]|uniref:Cytochrome P450 n=1 Tax=Fraxinus pennsylvanica TaxID=56036 RepID=A0AAD1YX54_9LAMI|nr:unnamed protein product [Fraxinus pennsylvanica]
MEIVKTAISVLTIIIFTVSWKILKWLWLDPRKKERILIIFTVSWKILMWVWLDPRKKEWILRQQGFKGNPYTIRKLLFGDEKEIQKVHVEALSKPVNIRDEIQTGKRAAPFIFKTYEKYGKKSFLWAGLRPKVFIMEPDLMKREEWSKRRTIMNPKFQLEKLKQMIPQVLKCSEDVIIEWKKLVSNSKDGSYTLDVCHDIEELISSVTSQFLFGIDYAKDKEIFHLITQLSELTKQATKVSNFPGSKYLPTETNRKSKSLTKELHQRLYKLMSERKKAIKEGKVVEDNVFNMLLQSEISNNQDEMIEWQDRAREEVFRVFGNRRPDYEGLSQLKVLPMFMNENVFYFGLELVELRAMHYVL